MSSDRTGQARKNATGGRMSMAGLGLDRNSDLSLYQQVATHLRNLILDGRLPAGTRLLGSRQLAAELGCSRAIVLAAFDLLYSEGYLQSVPRGGVEVAAVARPSRPSEPALDEETGGGGLSDRWRSVLDTRYDFDLDSPFSPGTPDLSGFPFDIWSRLLRQSWVNPPPSACAAMAPLGWPPLRAATAEYLGAVRGLLCSPEEVAITPASAGALDLCCRMLLDPSDEVWVEEPGFIEARRSLKAAGAKLVPVPVARAGSASPKASAARPTPSWRS